MKEVLCGVTLTILALALPAVVVVVMATKSTPTPLLPGEHLLSTKDKVTTEKIDGCEYLLCRGQLVHKGDCSNPKHLRGGALLEDWINR